MASEPMTREEYKEWEKTSGRFLTEYEHIRTLEDGKILMFVRNDEFDLKVGRMYGGATLLKIQAYGKDLDTASSGLTAALTFDRMPLLEVRETEPSFAEWLIQARKIKE